MTAFRRFDPAWLESNSGKEGPAKAAKAAKPAENCAFPAAKALLKPAKAPGEPGPDGELSQHFSRTLAGSNPQKTATLAGLATLAGGAAPENQDGAEPAWADAYHERRAIMLEDGGASEAKAHAVAYQEALQAWFGGNPLPEPQEGCCARCGGLLGPNDRGNYFYRDGPDVDPLPVHGRCIVLLQHERRRDAVRALAAAGITEKGTGS